MTKTRKPAAPALTITADCERDADGFGALGFVKHDNYATTRPDVSALKAMLFKAGFVPDGATDKLRKKLEQLVEATLVQQEELRRDAIDSAVVIINHDHRHEPDATDLFTQQHAGETEGPESETDEPDDETTEGADETEGAAT